MPKRYIRRPDGTLIEDSGAVVDSSLTISGAAADAKAVGDALAKKLNADRLNGAVEDALRQAKESGEFDGEPGAPGKDGDDYVLTEDDKTEIAEEAAKLIEVPGEGEYRLLKTITLTEEVTQIYETFETGYDGMLVTVVNGTLSSGNLRLYVTVGKGNYLRGIGANLASSQCMKFEAQSTNGIWSAYAYYGNKSDVSSVTGMLGANTLTARSIEVPDGFDTAFDAIYNLRLYSYSGYVLPAGMVVKIFVKGDATNA